MTVSVPLRRAAEASLEEGATVRIDLRECTWMDSTFLGTLLVLARRARAASASGRGARLFLVAPSAECRRVLDQTGTGEILDVVEMPELEGAEWTAVACDGDSEALARTLLRAHEELATFPGTKGAFREVARAMKQDAQRIGELRDPAPPERK